MNSVLKTSKKPRLLQVLLGLLAGLPALLGSSNAFAQLNPMGTLYFQNQYLANPALAGQEKGGQLNLAHRKQWSSFPGSPKSQSLTAEYGFDSNVGLGLQVMHAKTGLLAHTSAAATYAYHLPLSETRRLHFGLSAGFSNQSIDNSEIIGQQNDPSVSRFNDQKVSLRGDAGAAFTSGSLTLQGAALGLEHYLVSDPNGVEVQNDPTFFTAASYKFRLSAGNQTVGLEPKIAYRGLKQTGNIVDAGAQVSFLDNALNLFGMYHSTRAATCGVSVAYKSRIALTGIYTSGSAAMKDYAGGGFEIGLRLALSQP